MIQKIVSILVNLVNPDAVSQEDLLKFVIIFFDMFLFVISLFLILMLRLLKDKLVKVLLKISLVFIAVFIIFQIVVYLDMRFIEPNWIKPEHVTVSIPRLAKAVGNMKIVHISDLHVVDYGYRERRLVKIIKAENPDIIFFTGGMTRDDNSKEEIKAFFRLIKEFSPKYGIWMVPDYTDEFLFLQDHRIEQHIRECGVNILKNQGVKLSNKSGEDFWIIGVGDSSENADDINAAMWMVPIGEPKIVITHAPGVIDKAMDYDIDLVLAGDTQGGQCGLEFIRRQSAYIRALKYISGLYKVRHTYLYVNRGVGVKTSLYRFMCRPEVTIFNITD